MTEADTVDIAEVVETQNKGSFAFLTFFLCCLVMLVDGFDNQAINYAAPSIISDWGIDRELMTPVFSFSILGWMLGSIGFSMIGDRVGRRNSILLAVVIFGLFTLAIPLASGLAELSALRFCASLGIGGAVPMVVALLSDYAQAKSRALLITVLYLGYTVGSSGGGFLAADLTPAYGWKSIFLVGGIGALLVGCVLLLALPESVRYLVLSCASQKRILAYVRRLKPAAQFGSDTKFVIGEAAKKGLPVEYLFTEGRAAMTIFLWFALALSFVTHFYISAWLTTLLSEYSGQMSVPAAQRTQALFQMGAAFGIGMGWLLDRFGIPAVGFVMLVAALPVAALGLVDGTAAMMVLSSIAGILVLGSAPGLNAIAGMAYPTFMRCTGAGAAFAAARIGAIIGPVIAGALIALDAPLNLIFLVGAAPMLAAAGAAFMLDRSMTPSAAREMSSKSVLARH